MISLLEASASPATVAALVLVDSALPFVLARPDPVVATIFVLNGLPGLGGLLRSLRRDTPAEVQVGRLLALCCADPGRVPARTVAQHVEMERRRKEIPGRSQALITAMRSVVQLAGHRRGSTYRAILGKVGCPVLLLQGDRDRLVPVAVARAAARAHPSWTLEVLPGIGHVPQLEVPEETARLVTAWLGRERPGRSGRSGEPGESRVPHRRPEGQPGPRPEPAARPGLMTGPQRPPPALTGPRNPGDKVALQPPNIPQFLIAYFGILTPGCVIVPVNVILKSAEVEFQLADSGARTLITWEGILAEAAKGAATAGLSDIYRAAGLPGARPITPPAHAAGRVPPR